MLALRFLDRSFRATFIGNEVGDLFPEELTRQFISRKILSDAGISDTIPHCICDLRRTSCTVIVEADSEGVYWGYCNEAGSPIKVSQEQVRRYAFDPEGWAKWLRKQNRIEGAGPAFGKGCMYVGNGVAGGRAYSLVLIAPGCRKSSDILLPREAVGIEPPLVFVHLGEGTADAFDGLMLGADAVIGDDLVTLNPDRIEELLVDAPVVIQDKNLAYRCFTNKHKKGQLITEADCERLRAKEARDQFDLFIDLLASRIWRKGRACGVVLNKQRQSTGKKLGEKPIRLIGDYVKRPDFPMVPSRTLTYQNTTIDLRSASVLLTTAIRSINGSRFFRLAASGSEPGGGTYVFEPMGITYCLVERVKK